MAEAQTKDPGGEAGVGSGLLAGELDRLNEFNLQAQALEAKLSLPPHLARCVLLLLRGDVW